MPTLSVEVAKWIFEELPFTQLPLSEFTPLSNDPSPSKDPAVIRPLVTFIAIPEPTLKSVCT
jgi:hypothetical protein